MRRILPIVLLAAHFALITAASLWLSAHTEGGNLLTSDGADLALALGRLAGLWTASALLLQLVLIGRVRGVETVFGLDRLTRLHHFNGLAILALVAIHGALLTWSCADRNDLSPAAQIAEFWAKWDGLPGAMIGAGLLVLVVLLSLGPLRSRIRYGRWHALHLAAYAALALAFAHQFETGGDYVASRALRWYGYAVYALALGALLAWRVIAPVARYLVHRFAVAEVRPEAAGVVSVYVAGRRMERWRARGGQFVIVRFLARGWWLEAHPFSLSLPPGGDRFRITVKNAGDFTARVATIPPGTPVVVDGPHGVFTAAKAGGEKALLIAGGIGITPLRAMAADLVAAGRSVVLLHACRRREDVAFEREWDDLAASGRFQRHVILSDDPGAPGRQGRITPELLREFVPDAAGWDVFLCGPPAMMRALTAALRQMGVPPARIHFERFAL